MSCENCEESAYVVDKLAKLLAEIAVIVNGAEPHDTLWSYHDLPEKVRALKEAPPAAVVQPEYPSMFEFFVVMQKRSSGEVFPDLHKTNGQIYFTEEDAARALDADPELKPYRHVVRLLAQVTPPAALAVPARYVPLAAAEALALEAMRVGNLGGHERTVEGRWSAEVGDRFEEFMFEEGFAMLAAANKENNNG